MKSRTKSHAGRTAMTLAAVVFAGTLIGGDGHAAPFSRARARSDIIQRGSGVRRRLNLGVGKAVIVHLPHDAAEVVVADPAVANAIVRSSRRLYIIAMAGGQTTILALDAQGRQIATIDVTVGRNISELSHILKAAMPGSHIVLRTVDNTIILTGEVDSAEQAQKAMDIADGFVKEGNAGGAANGAGAAAGGANGGASGKVINSLVIRAKDEVMLKVTVAEVQRRVLKQLGITQSLATGQWGRWAQDNPLPLNGALTAGAAIFGNPVTGPLSATLTAFERDGVARVLAEPTVTAVSGESAKFTAGGKIPIPGSTCTAAACQVSFTYLPYGVTLNFTPVILSKGRILLHVATEVTETDPQQSLTFDNVSVPGFRTRKNETSVELPSGGSIVSAGLIQVQSENAINGLPGLMNLPILGQLFRSRDYQRNESELMIVVTPYIAKPVAPNQVALPTDGFADASDPQAWLLGRVNRIYATPGNPAVIRNFKGHVGFIDN